MIKSFIKEITDILKLRFIIGYNGLVFKLKNLPLIGKSLPDSLYASRGLKIIYMLWRFLRELAVMFLIPLVGMWIVIGSAWGFREALESSPEVLATLPYSINTAHGITLMCYFLMWSVLLVLTSSNIFKYSTEKEYSIFMLRMNAKRLSITLFVYSLVRLFVGYSATALLWGPVTRAPFWSWFFLPLLGVICEIAGAGLQITSYNIRRKLARDKQSVSPRAAGAALFVRTIFVFCLPLTAFLMFANAYVVNPLVVVAVYVLVAVFGLLGAKAVRDCDSRVYRRAIADSKLTDEILKASSKGPDKKTRLSRINSVSAVKVQSDKGLKGFKYFNDLFIRRFRMSLYLKSILGAAVFLFIPAMIILANYIEYKDSLGAAGAGTLLVNNIGNFFLGRGYSESDVVGTNFILGSYLTVCPLVMYLMHSGLHITQSMYINCDRSLMTYNFFKMPSKIMELFKVRLISIIKINLLPAFTLSVFINFLLFMFGGPTYFGEYMVTTIVVLLISVIQSVSAMLIYYLLQPYTEDKTIRTFTYNLVTIGPVIGRIIFCFIPIPSWLFAVILVALTAWYIPFAIKLVNKHAARTWRVRS